MEVLKSGFCDIIWHMKNDLLVWFDSKTGEKMKNQDDFIKQVAKIANKYGFDFSMSNNPKRMKEFLNNIDFE